MYHTQTIPNVLANCKCGGSCVSCKLDAQVLTELNNRFPSLQQQAPRPESRIFELQAKAHLSPGEKIELEMLLKKKWG